MADRKALTPAEIARRMAAPEENPQYENAPYKALLAPLAVYGGALSPELLGAIAGAGAKALPAASEAASKAPGAVSKAMEVLSTAPKQQIVRVGNVNRNLAASAPRVVRLSDGTIQKLAAGEAVPEGATVLNMAEAPVAEMIAGTAAGVGIPAALAAEYGLYRPSTGASAVTPQSDQTAPAASISAAPAPSNSDTARLAEQYGMYRPSPGTLGTISGQPSLGAWNQAPVQAAKETAKNAAQKAAPVARTQAAPAAQSQSGGLSSLLKSIFSGDGREYQSNRDTLYRGPQNKPTGVNWGNPDQAADFWRASKAMQTLPKEDQPPITEKRGGRVSKSNEHSAILHKALEIIHHMALKNH